MDQIITVSVALWRIAGEKHFGLIAAGVAFFGIFGLFPGIAAVIAVFGLLADPVLIAGQMQLMADIIPQDALDLLTLQVDRLVLAPPQQLGWTTAVSLVLALWSCRAAVSGLIGGLDAIAGQAGRGGLRHALVALGLSLVLVLLAVIAIILVVVLPVILALLPLTAGVYWLVELARWCIALAVLITGLSLLYRYGPAQTVLRGGLISWGAVVVVLVWVVVSAALSVYLANFAQYNQIYGSIGAVIGLLFWLYVSAYLVLLGAAVNLLLAQRSA